MLISDPKNKVGPMLETLLRDRFGISEFRPGQKTIIESILSGRDTLAVLPTGGGKSLCFQLPALAKGKLVICVSPLIALMKDQVASLQKRGIKSGFLASVQSEEERRQVFTEMKAGGPYILYLSPERVQKEGFKKWILSQDVALFAIDEAHCVSQWGHDFREEYADLKVLKTIRPDVPILALTASATPNVLDDVTNTLGLKNCLRLVRGFYRSNLYYQVKVCADEQEKLEWLTRSLSQFTEGRCLVYCGTRKVTEQIADLLSSRFASVGFYHAGLRPEDRNRIQEDYTSGRTRILVATNAFGMGIDQPDVRLVVHFQMPANIDSLYQEMGRAGRDGKPSTCLMLYSKKDKGLQSYFIQSSQASAEIKHKRWGTLEAIVSYSESSECRHREILTYYRDSHKITSCGHCDICEPLSSRAIHQQSKPIVVLKKALSKKASKKQKITLDLNPEQELRFQSLRQWRKAKAQELDLPAFVIFSDQTLRDLAIKNPKNLDSLKNVFGVGEVKADRFGWDLLAELSQ